MVFAVTCHFFIRIWKCGLYLSIDFPLFLNKNKNKKTGTAGYLVFCKPWPAVSSIVCPGLNNRQNWQIICLCKHLPLSFKQTNKQTKRFHVLHVYLKPGQTNWLKKYLQNLFYLLNEISHIVTFTFTWNVKCKMAKKIDLSFKSLKKIKV